MPSPIKPTIKTEFFSLLLIIVLILSSIYFYLHFPIKVPTHWNFAGEVDGWSSRPVGAFLIPGFIIGMYALFLLIPYLDPKKERYEQFAKIYHRFKFLILFFISVIYFLGSFNALGYNLPIDFWVPALIGVLFLFLGNYMGKIKPNWFMGIRTPWTMSSEEVWNKTHRVGGKFFMLGGLVLMLNGLYPINLRMPIFILAMIIILFGTIGYSYIAYTKEIKQKNHGKNN